MAVRRTVWRLGAVLVGVSTLGVALPTLAATERKCCDVRLREAAGSVTAGGAATTVTATVAARRKGCTKLRPRLTVRLSGLDADEIRVERVVRGGARSLPVRPAGAGVVQAREPVRDGPTVCGDGRIDIAYRLTFLAGAPTGRATLSAEADTPSGRVLGRDATATVVVDNRVRPPEAGQRGRVAPPAAPAPSSAVDGPAATAVAPPAAPAPSSAVDAPAATAAAPARLTPALVATGLGAVVAATVAMVAVLALRSRRREVAQAGPAEGGGLADPPRFGRQPTLADRWSSLAAAMRRPSRPGRVRP